MGLFDFISKKKNNSIDISNQNTDVASVIFTSQNPSIRGLKTSQLISSWYISYHMSMNIWNSNTVVSRFIDLISSSLQNIVIVNKEWDEITWTIPSKILNDIQNIFWDNDIWTYVYESINNFICCGMKISAPTVVDDNWYAKKIEVLDSRYVSIYKKWAVEELIYKSNKINAYSKKIIKPSIYRKWYWDCKFTGAIKDAMIDIASRDEVVVHFNNWAKPDIIFKLLKSQWIQVSDDWRDRFEKRLIEKHQGIDNSWLPLVSNIIDDVIQIDASPSLLKSVDMRLYSSNMLWMQLWVDIRALWYMRNGWSQAELYAVTDMVNSEISRYADYLSKSITSEYNSLVADTKLLEIRFIPKYFKNTQQVIDNALQAEKQKCVDKKFVQDLIYNNS